jgi:hypothetical protein
MKWFLKGIAMLVFFCLFAIAFGWLAMWLWNQLVPPIFHGPVLTYWQTVGLLVLARMFVGGWGGHHHHHHKKHWHQRQWRARWQEKMEKMSPEEREKFRTKMRRRCGWDFDSWEHQGNPWQGNPWQGNPWDKNDGNNSQQNSGSASTTNPEPPKSEA